MTEEQSARIVHDLVRFANDPKLDAVTRTWMFDALRDITGQQLGDDGALWRAWLVRASGHEQLHPEDRRQQLIAAVASLP